ncbi:MAG: DoxX family protein [Chitinophagaceae bacterium]
MAISSRLDRLHAQVKQNRWLRYFTIFCRMGLALGFLPSGFVKIMGERFTSLSVNHPMGHYLEALHHTGYYYTFIGVLQVTAAILLLIPRTATLGALLYFPIILNICILSRAVRFDGSFLSSPLMVLANLYLLCWDYDKLKLVLPFRRAVIEPRPGPPDNRFPVRFFGGVLAAVAILALVVVFAFDIKPRNTPSECREQCAGSKDPGACHDFCDCIHQQGRPLDQCLEEYHKTLKKARPAP